jgi:hypothetical protein
VSHFRDSAAFLCGWAAATARTRPLQGSRPLGPGGRARIYPCRNRTTPSPLRPSPLGRGCLDLIGTGEGSRGSRILRLGQGGAEFRASEEPQSSNKPNSTRPSLVVRRRPCSLPSNAVNSLLRIPLTHFNPTGGYDVPGLFQTTIALDMRNGVVYICLAEWTTGFSPVGRMHSWPHTAFRRMKNSGGGIHGV